MEILRWHERFSVGNKEMDFQHKMLLNFANYLTTGSGRGYNHQEMEDILEELINYTEYHFTAEEELLKEHPSIESHRKMHADFTKKVHCFEEEFKKGKETINSALFTFLVDWIQDHLLKTDIIFFKTLSEQTDSYTEISDKQSVEMR